MIVFRRFRTPFWLICPLLVGLSLWSWSPKPPATRSQAVCSPGVVFEGYSFLLPEIIEQNAAYAPFFTDWKQQYAAYFQQDIQRTDNLEEWAGRFCRLAEAKDVAAVVYEADIRDLSALHNAAAAKGKEKPPLPYGLAANVFAQVIAENGCTEAVDYLQYTRKVEPFVVRLSDRWALPQTDPLTMQSLIQEGIARFQDTRSHFIRLRYAYQVIRLAHYAGQWQQTVDLYNQLIPQIDQRRSSIVFYWALGHLAGALQQLDKYPEAAYRYALIFRSCPSKRASAFRSFRIRHDADWQQAWRLCKTQDEQITLAMLRAGVSRAFDVSDLTEIYAIDPSHPQLDLLVVGHVQQLEQIFLRTPVTDQRYGAAASRERRAQAAKFLVGLQQMLRQGLREQKIANPKLWVTLVGYLELLAGDIYAAERSFDQATQMLNSWNSYDAKLLKQLDVWKLLLKIMQFDVRKPEAEQEAFRIRSYKLFREVAAFEPFLRDWMSARYAETKHPGKSLLAGYGLSAIGLNPNPAVLNDLLKAATDQDPIFLEYAAQVDSNPSHLRDRLLEMKGMYLFNEGQPEAALVVLRQIPETDNVFMPQFTPFKETLHEGIHRPITDTLLLTRRDILEKLSDFEFKAKAAAALGSPDAARYYYLIGLAHYNMSYFGHAWNAMDTYRSGYNWLRLAQGPVFPLASPPHQNREYLDVGRALNYFEMAYSTAKDPEWAARAAFMAARCQQKQWFMQADTRYRAGSRLIPVIPAPYNTYYILLHTRYNNTQFYARAIKECKWLAAYGNH